MSSRPFEDLSHSLRPSPSPSIQTTTPPDLAKGYEPKEVESRWYTYWENAGVFRANSSLEDRRPVYVCPMPPPNVTGSLHMGHAMFCTLQDVLVRFHRMSGYNVLYQPGIDHAGIATQTVVERQIAREGKTKTDLGRDEFEKRIWKWKEESGGQIAAQQRILGISADWARSKFTMDKDMAAAVTHAFVRLYEEGLMYRATRLINWDPVQQTSLSDLEVEYEESNGELFDFAYRVLNTDGSLTEEELIVATTRPETMLGDTAVAIHPDDPRYKHLHGRQLHHPFSGRVIPIITDSILVDPTFGTGAVKVTPAHDFNDFATGKRHSLAEINVFNKDATLNREAGPFEGLTRERARTAVKKALAELGLAKGSRPHRLTLPRSERSSAIVEPMISTQWFLNMGGMAKQALDAVREGEVTILPAEWTKTYEHFLNNIQDWCVSRQLWWGHPIPAWHGPDGKVIVASEKPAHLGPEWQADPDVLDTWFSSALWPFSTQGWPKNTDSFQKFYPASDLETGYDILFFWVARMIMFGKHFTGRAPFKRVLLHGLIVDEMGDKMSKVKGNVIDPLDLIYGAKFSDIVKKTLPGAKEEEALAKFKKAYPSASVMGAGFPAFGTDALRFTLAGFPPSNKRIALAPKRIETSRHFVNKIWNGARLVLDLISASNRELSHLKEFQPHVVPNEAPSPNYFFNRWILSRLSETCETTSVGIQTFRIDEATNALYKFFWNDFCDWYLEIAKHILRDETNDKKVTHETCLTLLYVLDASLRLVHPIMPYVTEELWQRLPRAKEEKNHSSRISISLSSYPHEKLYCAQTEQFMTLLQTVITAARTIRSEHEVHPASHVNITLFSDNASAMSSLAEHVQIISKLTKSDGLVHLTSANSSGRKPGTSSTFVPHEGGAIEVVVDLRGHVTKERELARIERELKRIEKDVTAIEKKLQAKGFIEKAPAEVVREAMAQKQSMVEAKTRLIRSKKHAEEL